MTRTASLARNVLSNWIVLAANIGYVLVITPLLVHVLGKDLYGVWSFLNGLLVYSDLLYLGLGSAVIKYVAQFRVHDDRAGLNRLASVVLSIYLLLGLFCLLVLVSVSHFVPGAFAEPLSASASRAATITCMLLGTRLVSLFVGSAFAGVVHGHDRFDLVNTVSLIGVALRFVGAPIALGQTAINPLIAIACLTTAVGAVEAASLAITAFRIVPSLRLRPTRPTAAELRWLYGFGVQSFFVLLAVKLISYTDTTVIAMRHGAASVAVYVLPLQLVEYARMMVGGFSGVFLPRVTVLTARGETLQLRFAYLRSARIACFLAGWLAALLITLGPEFLDVWVGRSFGAAALWIIVCLALAGFAQVLSSQVPLPFYQALHLLRVPAAVLMAEALVNLSLSIWLAPRMGLLGVAVATVVPASLSAAVLPPFLCRKLGLPAGTLLRQSIAPGLALLLAVLALELAVGKSVLPESYPGLILRATMTVPLALAIAAVTFPRDEWAAMRQLLVVRRARTKDPQTL
jgi:O-antigen/teichoic acid export membrane protein